MVIKLLEEKKKHIDKINKINEGQMMVAHATSTQEPEAGGSLSVKPT